jgi:hypothetical protein
MWLAVAGTPDLLKRATWRFRDEPFDLGLDEYDPSTYSSKRDLPTMLHLPHSTLGASDHECDVPHG